ncbi:MAG: LuxR family transcriptional regulator, partial [Acidimicrobiales bacterium]
MLGRLARHEVAELLATVYRTSIPWHVVDAVHRRTGGNPFFVEELVLAAGRGDPERLLDLPLPWGLSEIVLRNLDDLTDEQRQVVDAAAVLGERFPFDVLAAVAGVDEDGLIATLRSLVGAGLVVESETDVFSFRHALTREAVVARLLGRQRRRIHEKALAVLEATGSRDYWALAIHAEGAGRFDQVVEYARQGARHYLHRGATHQALRLAEVGLCED